ncbi:unnamed protein product [Soboliphyme baturini]|uniref:Eka-like protein n=1 Tax=Soboliphyme baturini TaxID=241478 RepID=A0A183IT65_9BILA|nr:unnamed protein product [Soboliphyme baturini]
MKNRSGSKTSKTRPKPSVSNLKSKRLRPPQLQRLAAIDESDDEAMSIQFLKFKEFDVASSCPVLSSTVTDTDDTGVHFASDDLDSLQFELEDILAHVATCQRQLEDALLQLSGKPSSLTNTAVQSLYAVNTSTSSLSSSSKTATSSRQKHKAITQGISSSTPLKRQRLTAPLKSKFRRSVTSCVSSAKQGANKSKSGRKYFWPQNRIPDRFWNFVDEFAGVISRSDTSTLKRLIEETDSSRCSEFYELPSSGKHYCLRNGDAVRMVDKSVEPLSDFDDS